MLKAIILRFATTSVYNYNRQVPSYLFYLMFLVYVTHTSFIIALHVNIWQHKFSLILPDLPHTVLQ